MVPVVTFHDLYSFRRYGSVKSEVDDDFHAIVDLFGKKDPLQANFQRYVPKGLMASGDTFVKFGRPQIGKVARCLPDKKNKVSGRSPFCADRAQNLPGPAPDNILGVPQISFKSVYFRRSYSRTHEHC